MTVRFSTTSIGAKIFLIGVIIALLLIPLMMLRGAISERSALREQAYQKVADGWGGDLVIGGPILVIPTEREIGGGSRSIIERKDIYLLPAQQDADVQLQLETEPRYVGIYAVPVYLSHVHIKGQFDFRSVRPLLDQAGVTYLWDQARLRLPLSEVRTLREVRQARFAGRDVKLGPGARGLYVGVEAPVDPAVITRGEPVSFEFVTTLAGSRSFSILPLGSTTTVTLKSDWPHPSFQGAFLPAERQITDTGFTARWQVLELNRSYGQAWMQDEFDVSSLVASSFGVGLYQAVDVYQRGERAIKYALLFIALTFLTFFAWERVSRLRIHPLQYMLVGLALSVFYLLLLALSEHIAFGLAYLIAAVALVLLIGIYLAGALNSHRRGIVAGAAMTVVYGLLYILVLSEDYALLLGAIILFTALAAVMLATRRISWYGEDNAAETA